MINDVSVGSLYLFLWLCVIIMSELELENLRDSMYKDIDTGSVWKKSANCGVMVDLGKFNW